MKKIIAYTLLLVSSSIAEPLFNSYLDNKELDSFIENLSIPNIKKEVLAITEGNNKIHCLKLSSGKVAKPAILILGDTHSASPVGSEILVQWLKLSALDEGKKALQEILKHNSLYIIPRPFPDSLNSFFQKPYRENLLNTSAVDADVDLVRDEDGFEDLNKDGFITYLRIKDEDGQYYQHKDSEYIMTKSPNSNGTSYKLISEGIDNDKDEKFNEDPPGGVNPNKNFSYAYPYFQKDAGVHQFSEIETKAIADFAFSHPEIFLVFSFGREDNLVKPWKEDQNKKKNPIRSTIYKDDEKNYELYSSHFKDAFKLKKVSSKNLSSAGSFAHWAYYHFGRISLTTIPWEIPIDKIEGKQEDKIKEIKWLEENRPQALIKWQKIEHPDFKGKEVEVGGIKPFYSFVPEPEVCKDKAIMFNTFLQKITEEKPEISVREFKVENLGKNLSRINLKIRNTGKLPFRTKIGEASKKQYPLNLKLKLPKNWKLYDGHLRSQIGNIKPKEEKELTWLILTNGKEGDPKIFFTSPHIIDFSIKMGDIK